MASARTFLTPDGFDSSRGEEEKPYLEYWFGEAIPKQMPTAVHGVFQWILAMMLDRLGWRTATEVRLMLSSFARPIPDLVADPITIEDPYPVKPFGLCVEIMSPQDDLSQLFKKAAHYLDWKVDNVWIIDPQDRKAYSMTLSSPAPVEITADGQLVASSAGKNISLALHELFAEVDSRLSS